MNQNKQEQIKKTRSKMTREFLEQFKISEFIIQGLLKRVDYTIKLCTDQTRQEAVEEVQRKFEEDFVIDAGYPMIVCDYTYDSEIGLKNWFKALSLKKKE